MNIQGLFPLGLTTFTSLQSKGLSRVFSSTIIKKHQFFITQPSFGPTLTSIHNYWKNHSLTIQTFISKVMSLLLNILSRVVIAFLPRSKYLNFVAVVTVRVDFGTQENKVCHCFHFPPSICHEVRGPDTPLVSWISSFVGFFILLFHLHKEAL